jgi:hypothetical protein
MARGQKAAVERAILVEALRGATRTELWLAARLVARFVSTDEVDQAVNTLMAAGQLEKTGSRWTTTPAGQARLDRSTA